VPVVYRCSSCGFILYVHWRVGQSSYGVPTPSEIVSMYGGVCPRCGHRLNTKPSIDDVDVVARRELVEARLRLLKRLLEERPRLLALHVPVRRLEVAAHG